MHTSTSYRPVSEDVRQRIREIAERQLDRLDELVPTLQAAVVRAAPELGGDPTLYSESLASTRANCLRFLQLMVSHPGEPVPGDPPPESVDIARSVMRRGAETEIVVLTYRAGQNAFWDVWLDAAAELVADRDQLVEVLRLSSVLIFNYIDGVLARVLARAEEEREELLRGGLARRAETVRMILDDVPIDEQQAAERLGYRFSQTHTCVVLWSEEGVEQGALDRAAHTLARAAGAHGPLVLPATVATAWAWIGTTGEPDLAKVRAAMANVDPAIRAAVGPSCSGLVGFRRSHHGAIDTHGLVAGAGTGAGTGAGERLTTYLDVEVTALVAHDPGRMTDFVRTTLGTLAGSDAAAARLRETLHVYLREGENAPRAAERLYTHRNTVLQRIARAEELLGHPIADRRLELALALELCHRLGGRTLA
jgi:DNA-binding PucR family transcriptional regulator